jgi:hypothetical protein
MLCENSFCFECDSEMLIEKNVISDKLQQWIR